MKSADVTMDRQVLSLFRDGKLNYEQIGDQLGLTHGQVDHALRRARAAGYNVPPEPAPTEEETFERILKHAQEAQALLAQIDPVYTHREIVIETDGPIAVLLAGCFQLGGRWTTHEMFRAFFEQWRDYPFIRYGFLGDEIENFFGEWVGRRSREEQALSILLQKPLWYKFLKTVARNVLFGVHSQHGSIWDERASGVSFIKQTYLDHGIPFFDGMGYIKLRVGQISYNLAIAHGFPGSSIHNPLHAQWRALWQRYPNADVIAQADKHNYAQMKRNVYGNEYLAGNRASPFVHLLQVGTLKTGPDPYSIRGWERGFFGWPFVVFWPDRHQIEVTDNPDIVLHLCGNGDTGPLLDRLREVD